MRFVPTWLLQIITSSCLVIGIAATAEYVAELPSTEDEEQTDAYEGEGEDPEDCATDDNTPDGDCLSDQAPWKTSANCDIAEDGESLVCRNWTAIENKHPVYATSYYLAEKHPDLDSTGSYRVPFTGWNPMGRQYYGIPEE